MNTIELVSPVGEKEINITDANTQTFIRVTDIAGDEKETQFSLVVNITEECTNGKVTVCARYETQKTQKKIFNLSVVLHGKHQSVDIDVKGISDDTSLLNFNGGGVVAKNSEECSVHLVQKIYLFSQKSRAKATPVLRVETDNIVSASHSASVSPFSKDIFFYMATRGIQKQDAKILLREGLLFPNNKV